MDYRSDRGGKVLGFYSRVISFLILLCSSVAFSALDGTLYVVDSLEDTVAADGYLTLREAVGASNDNIEVNEAPAGSADEVDIIIFAQSLLNGTGQIVLNGTLNISDSVYIEASVFSPLDITGDFDQPLIHVDRANASLTLSGFRFANSSLSCLAIDNAAKVNLNFCVFEDNTNCINFQNTTLSIYGCEFLRNATSGNYNAVVYGSNSQIDIVYSNFYNNSCEWDGGVICLYESYASLSQCYFAENFSLEGGGAIFVSEGVASVSQCDFTDNSCEDNGGAILAILGAATIYQCDFTGNISHGSGGAIYESEGVVSISQCDFTENSSVTGGGALYVVGGYYPWAAQPSSSSVHECTFLKNTSETGPAVYCKSFKLDIEYSDFDSNIDLSDDQYSNGSIYARDSFLRINHSYLRRCNQLGLYFRGGHLSMDNCVVTGNCGGGIYLRPYYSRLVNCTIAGNCNGPGIITSYREVILTNTIIADNYSGEPGSYYEHNTVSLSNAYIINSIYSIEAGFVRRPSPGSDEIWGTDDDDLGDLHLRPDSPAVALAYSGLSESKTDIEGVRRDDDEPSSIGAYEFTGEPGGQFESPSTTVTTSDDIVDFSDNLISLREALMYCPLTYTAIDFDPSLDGQTFVLSRGPLVISGDFSINTSSMDITIDASYVDHAFVVLPRENEVIGYDELCYVRLEGIKIIESRESAILAQNSILTIRNCEITDCDGAISYFQLENYDDDCELNIMDSYMACNRSDMGGAVYCRYLDDMEILMINNVIVGNTADENGGAIYIECNDSRQNYGGELAMINNTIVGNIVRDGIMSAAGGVDCSEIQAYIYNTIITQNFVQDRPSDLRGYPVLKNCIISEDPIFVRNPDIGEDGWWDVYDDDFGNLRLRADSPAIDAGDCSYFEYYAERFYDDEVTDFNGDPRVVGSGIDIGAYEYQIEGPLADIDGNGDLDILDFLVLKSNFGTTSGATHGQGDLDSDGDVDIYDFMIFKGFYCCNH